MGANVEVLDDRDPASSAATDTLSHVRHFVQDADERTVDVLGAISSE